MVAILYIKYTEDGLRYELGLYFYKSHHEYYDIFIPLEKSKNMCIYEVKYHKLPTEYNKLPMPQNSQVKVVMIDSFSLHVKWTGTTC